MKRAAWLLLLFAWTSGVATAQEDLCADAAVSGQKLRRAGRLREAREQFVSCSQARCVREVSDRCVAWLREIDAALPSIVIVVKDQRGADYTGGRLYVDGIESRDALLGRPIHLDPGIHLLKFDDVAKFVTAEERLVVREGEKERRHTLNIPYPPPPRAVSTMVGVAVLGGVGVVASGLFGYFGLKGVSDRTQFGCESGCSNEDFHQVRTEFAVASVALGVAVVSLTAAGVLYLLRPRTRETEAQPLPGGRVLAF